MAYLYDLWIADTNNSKLFKMTNPSHALDTGVIVGGAPRALAVDLDGVTVWVANMKDNTVSKISNGLRIKDIAVGKSPMGIAVGKKAVYVANYGSNTISKIVNNFVQEAPIPVGSGPRGICVDKNEVIWVANFLSCTVSKIVDGVKVKDIKVGLNPYGICVDKTGAVWVANSSSSTVSKIVNGEKILDLDVGKMPYGICCGADGAIYVTNYVGDSVTKIVNSVVKIKDIPVGDGPFGISSDKDGKIYVSNSGENKISVIYGDAVTDTITIPFMNPMNFGDATGMQSCAIFGTSNTGTGKVYFEDLDPSLQAMIQAATGGRINAVMVDYDHATLTDVDKALDFLLYTSPAITSFNNSVNVAEVGSTVNNVTLTWALNKAMTSQVIDQGVGSVAIGTVTVSLTGQGITTNKTWTLVVGDGQNTASKTTSVVFQNKRYWGVSASTSLTDAEIIALTSEFATARTQSRVLNASGGKYLYFAMPSGFACDESKFKVGGLYNSDWVKTTRAFVNASGTSVSYDIFRSTNLQNGSAISVEIV